MKIARPHLMMQPTARYLRPPSPFSGIADRRDAATGALRRRGDRDPLAELQSLLDKLPSLVVRLHRSATGQWAVPYACSAFVRLCGISMSVLRIDARALVDCVHGEDLRRIERDWYQVTASAQPIHESVRLRRRHGPWTRFDASALADPAPDGGVYWNVLLRPQSSPSSADTDLQQRQERWQLATAAADIGIVELDVAGGTLHLDAVACRHHGLDSEPHLVEVEAWMAQVVEADRAAARALWLPTALAEDRMRLSLGIDAGTEQGTRTLEFVLQAVEGQQRLVGTCTDVTQRQTLDALKRDKLDAEKASRSKSEFMSRVSHELRTPLNGILGFAQLMALDSEAPLPPAQAQRLEVLRHSGSRLLSLIDQLLEVSRIEQGRLRLRHRPTDVRLLVERCADEMMPLAQQRGIELMVQIPPNAPPVRADAEALEQVLTNLLSNAIKYNLTGGQVSIVVEPLGSTKVQLRIEDSGVGMTPSQLDQLFQPFNRVGAEKTQIEGTGLGLVIARELTLGMSGTIDVTSTPNTGSCFTVTLPQAKGSRRGLDSTDTMPAQTDWVEAAGGTALYIEDDPVNAMLMREVFARLGNWRLLEASTGAEGLKLARAEQPELLLTDMNLPDMSGLDIVRQIRQHPATRLMHVIAVTADALPQQQELARQSGVDGYWTKPLDLNLIFKHLRVFFSGRHEPPVSTK